VERVFGSYDLSGVDKLERLLNLTVALLHTPRTLTKDELRERIPGAYPEDETAFHRAFERDKDDLRLLGIPLITDEVPGSDPPITGYRILPEDYYLPDPGLDPDELGALHLAATAIGFGSDRGLDAVRKLGGAPGDASPSLVATVPADDRLEPLFSAMAERRPVTFTYKGGERSVDPYRLDFQRGHWYLSAFDRTKDDERLFRVDRIEGDVAVGEAGSFDPPATEVPGLRLSPWELGEGEPVAARVLVDPDQAAWAVHQVGDDAVVEHREDGSVVIEVQVTNRDAFRWFVLERLDHAEVLEPVELRDELVAWLTAVPSMPAGGG
jgi:predicted DNA-binding transcriptional regulator YafY